MEFKSWRDMPPESADQFYRYFRADSRSAGVPYFLLITPARVYLWASLDGDGERAVGLPQAAVESVPRYLAERTREPVDHHILMVATFQWLLHLAEHDADPNEPAEAMLSRYGFVGALKDAHLALEPAA